MNASNRVLGRLLAQELTEGEIAEVAGGASGGSAFTYSGGQAPWFQGGKDDTSPTDEF